MIPGKQWGLTSGGGDSGGLALKQARILHKWTEFSKSITMETQKKTSH